MSFRPPVLRTLAFGDLDGPIWGAAWICGEDLPAPATLGGGDRTFVAGVALSETADGGDWRLEGDHAALVAAPAGEAVGVGPSEDQIDAEVQLCRVTGRFTLDGTEHAVDCLGLRTTRSGAVDVDRLESIRAVSTWFEPDEGFALIAVRGRKAKAHDADVITAAVLGPEHSAAVAEPRLSTTYSVQGWPIRAGLELWVEGEDEGKQYPRRASGEATGARGQAASGPLDVRAERFRWHSRGRDGVGVYFLAHRR